MSQTAHAATIAPGHTAEHRRLAEIARDGRKWRRWGPYLSERQWGTVREDYSAGGDAWAYIPHDHARSRAYRWGEDGIAGVSDWKQRLCLALTLWNHRDPILKERLFGLPGGPTGGNHGEDVKEYYYYLDATPTHSYLKYLYKYPQAAFPYGRLIAENPSNRKHAPEFELMDAGVFDEDRYFDVCVEYAKAATDDILMLVTVCNRGPEAAPLDVLPQFWFRNTWSWSHGTERPQISVDNDGTVLARHADVRQHGIFHLYCDGGPELLFCDNDTNIRRLYGRHDAAGHFKDGINDFVVGGDGGAVNPNRIGTKMAARHRLIVPAGGEAQVRLRLAKDPLQAPFAEFDSVMAERRREADEFYAALQADICDPDVRLVQRQALAGMIWSKQFYHYDVPRWLDGDPAMPPPPAERRHGRNAGWRHLNNSNILSMPDTWEYPWFAAWDAAFHCLPLALVDAEFAKNQLLLYTRECYSHPNGQLPAYEWNFGDVNPPVHAWATWRVFQIDRKQRGDRGDIAFLERVFHKLLLNFTWWVNRKDVEDRNVFQGGFLGLDNIGVFDRSAPLPTGGHINQADGTAWMAMYCLNMLRISLELALHNPVYEDIATKFFEHFLHIAEAMNDIGGRGIGLWDDEDRFFYDVLNVPGGFCTPLKVRSMVGLIPLFAVEVIEQDLIDRLPAFRQRLEWYLRYRPELCQMVAPWEEPGVGKRHLLGLLRGFRMKRVLEYMLKESEFLSPYGIRALSRYHHDHPYVFHWDGAEHTVKYLPGESDNFLFGGNSNWRGPIWFPVNYLIIESLQKFHHYYGDDFRIPLPTPPHRDIRSSGSPVGGRTAAAYAGLSILEIADELSRRLVRIFLRDETGRRPVFGDSVKFQTDPHFRDHLLFYEYFHGDTGRGIGASHQTGWTGLVAKLIQPRRSRAG